MRIGPRHDVSRGSTRHAYGATRRAVGFTLLEALIASFIVAVAAVGVGSMLAASSQQSSSLNETSISQALARQLMEEIASHPIEDGNGNISLGHESGETNRASYDQIDDYSDYADTTTSIQMLDGTTIDLGDRQTYSRNVVVQYRQTPGGAAYGGADAPFCVVTVTVTAENGKSVKLVRLFSRTKVG